MKRGIKIWMGLAVLLLTFSSSVSALTFNDIVSRLGSIYEVKNAEIKLKSTEEEIKQLKNPGDWSIYLGSGLKTVTQVGDLFPEDMSVTGSLNVKIPLGLTPVEKEKLGFAYDAYTSASANVESARLKSFVSLHALYQTAWLLQEEEEILNKELEAAVNKAKVVRSQYENGSVSLSELTAVQEELWSREESLSQELTKQRITWYELSFTANMAIREEVLERYELPMEKLPSPPELSVYAYENSTDLKEQEVRISQIKQSIARLDNTDMTVSIKPYFGIGDHAISVEYSSSDPGITTSYTFPVYSDVTSLSQGSSDSGTWSGGITFGISYSSGSGDSLAESVLKTSLEQERLRLDYMRELLSLQIRNSYQQYLKAGDLLGQAERELERTLGNKTIVDTKAALGQAAEYEQKEAEALVLRAKWKVESARIEVEKTYLNAALAASWGNWNE